MRYQLGHHHGDTCMTPRTVHDFTVLSINGIHLVHIDFCACEASVDENVQILASGWWPSTNSFPRSAATIDLLKQFHKLNLNGCLPALEYYRTLEDISDPEGLGSLDAEQTESSSANSDEDLPVRHAQLYTTIGLITSFRTGCSN